MYFIVKTFSINTSSAPTCPSRISALDHKILKSEYSNRIKNRGAYCIFLKIHNFINGLNLENPITKWTVEPYFPGFLLDTVYLCSLYLDNPMELSSIVVSSSSKFSKVSACERSVLPIKFN